MNVNSEQKMEMETVMSTDDSMPEKENISIRATQTPGVPNEILTDTESLLEEFEYMDPCSVDVLDEAALLLWKLENLTGGFDTPRGLLAIRQGLILNAIKRGLKKEGRRKRIKWGTWCKEKARFMGKRKRENLMLLAERTDVHPFAAFGVERMLQLIRASKNIDGADPIRYFLQENHIALREGDLPLSVDMKAKLDEALLSAKAKRTPGNSEKRDLEKFERLTAKFDEAITAILENGRLLEQVNPESAVRLAKKLDALASATSKIRETKNVVP